MKHILIISFDPAIARGGNASSPDPEQVKAAGEKVEASVRELGFEVTSCKIDFGETAEAVLDAALAMGSFDGIVIGVGIRTLIEHTVLFESLVNLVHRKAPGARFVFNTSRDDTAESVLRVLGGEGQ